MPPMKAASAGSANRGDKLIALKRPPERQSIRPIYIRLPAAGERCPYTGLSRSGLADVCVANKANNFRPPVKSFRLRRKGDKRAVRLIVFESLMSYLRQFEEAA